MEQTFDLNEVIQVLGLPLWLIVAGMVIATIGSIWLLVVAFQESVLWGLGSLLVPFVQLIFVVVHWAEAKGAFLVSLLGSLIILGGVGMLSKQMASDNPEMRALMEKLQAERFGDFEPGAVELPEPTPAPQFSRNQMAKILADLKEQERDLRERKAALAPDNKAGAHQIALEIEAYNRQLKEATAMAAPYRKKAENAVDVVESEASAEVPAVQ